MFLNFISYLVYLWWLWITISRLATKCFSQPIQLWNKKIRHICTTGEFICVLCMHEVWRPLSPTTIQQQYHNNTTHHQLCDTPRLHSFVALCLYKTIALFPSFLCPDKHNAIRKTRKIVLQRENHADPYWVYFRTWNSFEFTYKFKKLGSITN